MGIVPSGSAFELDLQATPAYCLGSSKDIHFAAQDDSTNQLLENLKQHGDKIFIYRIRQPPQLQYFCQHAQALILLRPWGRQENAMGIVCLGSRSRLTTQTLMMLLRRELKIEQNESLFLYQRGRLCQTHEPICPEQKQKRKPDDQAIVLHFSKMEISG